MADSRREPAVTTEGLRESALWLVLFLASLAFGAVLFALALLPAAGAAGRAVQEVAEEFDAIGSDVNLAFPRIPERSTIYASDGSVLATLYLDENRKIVRLDQVNSVTRNAVLAIEDARFYEHPGLDVQGIARALISNLRAGQITQGASTITQQLARNVFSTIGTEETVVRKLHEARVAMRLEQLYSKDQILELYLNEVYFGRGVYGVGTAAEYYFGKPVEKLALTEAAMLAGLISSPETYSPVNDEAAAVARRNVVIARMSELGMVTPEEAAAALAAPLGLHITEVGNQEARFPFFIEYVKHQILNDPRFGRTKRARIKTLFQGGLRIYTTLDPKLQRTGEAIIRSRFRQPGPESAVAAVDPRTGAVLSVVGGTNFRQSQVNVATGQGGTGRQSGSAFKPFTLVAAFEEGIPLGKVYDSRSGQYVNCTPYGPPRYKAVNAESSGGGYVDLREATARSINAVFVQLAVDVGPPDIVDAAQRMGIVSPLTPFCSITLGTNEVTPLEMASAFGTLANSGVHCEPFAIRRVVGPEGGRLLKQRSGDCEQAVSREIADRVAGLLRLVIESGTGTAANLGQWPAFGKTGTTNDSADVWFSGCTRQVCAATWVGHEEARIPMPGAYGGTVAAPVWQDFMLVAMRGNPPQGLPPIPEPEQARVPDVVGETKAAAVDILVKAHFTPQVEVVPHAPPANVVIAQNPPGDTATVAGSRVEIKVSSGVVPTRTVPNVVGRREASAVARLEGAGFVVQVTRELSSDPRAVGRVGAQTPGPGTELPKGSTVAIVVYDPAPPPAPPAAPPEEES